MYVSIYVYVNIYIHIYKYLYTCVYIYYKYIFTVKNQELVDLNKQLAAVELTINRIKGTHEKVHVCIS